MAPKISADGPCATGVSAKHNCSAVGAPLPLLTTHEPAIIERSLRGVVSFATDGSQLGAMLVERALGAIGSLIAARPRVPLCSSDDLLPHYTPGLDVVCQARSDFTNRLGRVGPPGEGTPVAGSCLSAVVQSADTVMGEDVCTVRGYDSAKLTVLRPGHTVVDVLPLLDADTRRILMDPDGEIMIAAEDLDEDAVAEIHTYVDPAFQDRGVFIRFVQMLTAVHMLVFRLTRRSTIGVFFVLKKLDQIRMVLDCRVTNALCRTPPHTALSTPSALSRVQIFEQVLCESGECPGSETDKDPYEGLVVALDLVDSFYQLGYTLFSDMFALPYPVRAGEVNITTALDADGVSRAVESDDFVFACIGCIGAGWS